MNRQMKRQIKWFFLLCGGLAMIACTALQSINTDSARTDLKPGDTVEIHRNGGDTVLFKVEKVDDTGLHGGGFDVPYSDIKEIRRTQVSWWRTGLVGAGVAAVIVFMSGKKSGGGALGW